MTNKIKFGLKKVHYAKKINTAGVITYESPKPFPGSVELSLEPRGDMIEFYADDMLYYNASNNQGYDGTLTTALVPDAFAEEIMGEQLSSDGLLTESTTDKGSSFALMFEFDGDKKATRHVLWNCSASRPTVGSSTKNDAPEPSTDELTFVASAREDNNHVKTKTTATTSVAVYDAWYDAVPEPATTPAGPVDDELPA